MKIYLASDHAGHDLKEEVKKMLLDSNYEVEDATPALDEGDDYPTKISSAARQIAKDLRKDTQVRGIIFGGSGQGESIVANKFPGIRSVVYYGGPLQVIKLSREHNDANVLSLGARLLTSEESLEAVRIWLETPFSNEERHMRRIDEIRKLEKSL